MCLLPFLIRLEMSMNMQRIETKYVTYFYEQYYNKAYTRIINNYTLY